ncbi:hypothetical protein P3342_003849 [Pyrenophora teres f. teres]|uniref:Uncharacterized protein n=2 Tax=Pyrenophora teres f. teres TaxID=97479 RepID=E3RTX3_PYRTT|nr:hypothetical protein PTT_12491 [Pyrenophora teres f. teres 0-1]KAE8842997.1 hypothetical protein HRS9139_02294 [Pyrenophora teres f. teres]KAE8849948.1 hypothetical protein PTNB85_00364 [Pyrenophora teres f. teres]KAE8852029.1 hypothetical protein HRS9122_02316 [Pyrenophora teres f. teres]KAE8870699.1 hypothetical protein PTNB29_01043 [Pyrenophora teres f. teres]
MLAPRAMYFTPIQLLVSTRCASRASISSLKSVNIGFAARSRIPSQSRFASKSSPPRNPKTSPLPRKLAPPISKAGTKNTPSSNPSKIKVTSAAKAKAIPTAAKVENKTPSRTNRSRILGPADFEALARSLDAPRLMRERVKLLWPGIWTISAVVATYGVFAYMDANYGGATSPVTLQSDRPETSDSWFLTPSAIRDGIKTAWQDPDKLTVGIIGFSAAILALRRSGLFSLVHLVHVTGRHKYTAFTHPFIYKDWVHLGGTSFLLACLLPGLVRHFDGDLYHTAAFLVSVSLVMPYLHHFVYRTIPTYSIPVARGAAYVCVAIFGASCAAHVHEKMWVPVGVVLRLPGEAWGLLYVVLWSLLTMKSERGPRALALVYGLGHFGLGAAYVHFDGKNKVWKPLVERFSTPALISH